MCAWKEHEHIDFNFTDCQLTSEVNSEDESYIKQKRRGRITMAGKYILLIGEDTRYKHKYVLWETRVALEKGCTVIGVNLNGKKALDEQRCPAMLRNVGALFVPFSARIIHYALENYRMQKDDFWAYEPQVYRALGYAL